MKSASKKTKRSRTSAPRSAAVARSDRSVDITRLLNLVAAFPRQTICVVGDFVLDQFVTGDISRVSREAPILILRHRKTETYPGGGANAVNNLADLGAKVLAVGVVGDDEGGRALLAEFRRKKVNVAGVVRSRDWVTTTKTRYLAGWTHTTEQQVLRVDREPHSALDSDTQARIRKNAQHAAQNAGAVLVSDYGLGAATPELVKSLRSNCITLDSRYRLLEYRGAGITAATPNAPEVEAAHHGAIGTDTNQLEELGKRTLRHLGLGALVVTRGKDGLAVFERSGDVSRVAKGAKERVTHLGIYGSDAPVDVSGAGDTVIAVFTLALAAGASYLEAAHLANYAGGIVVMKRRTATVTRTELEAALRAEATNLR
ncbi:MAG: bifunctional ADP-heptose synthase [Candidatus Acidiferrales bacterium]